MYAARRIHHVVATTIRFSSWSGVRGGGESITKPLLRRRARFNEECAEWGARNGASGREDVVDDAMLSFCCALTIGCGAGAAGIMHCFSSSHHHHHIISSAVMAAEGSMRPDAIIIYG